ncbi:Protein of unknown function [Pyronema omphalodes CBS 100304]|uniref:Uncharacterized protein n=1 Tax=Pyronema omphalodes (strain CBS 100304) TaxID=1076935 RepID=U4L3C3_PYROM|nr:Protein of unknown function [Pyronema omphalodes CBS 100304]
MPIGGNTRADSKQGCDPFNPSLPRRALENGIHPAVENCATPRLLLSIGFILIISQKIKLLDVRYQMRRRSPEHLMTNLAAV